jgi:hypothetical protein
LTDDNEVTPGSWDNLKDEILAATCTTNHNFLDLNMATINHSSGNIPCSYLTLSGKLKAPWHLNLLLRRLNR